MAHNKVRVEHALKVLSGLEEMKEKKIACDFEIKVSQTIFPVHKAFLIATSPYFERLFSSEMKEVCDGYIVMKGVSVEGVEKCLNFAYTGEVRVSSSNIHHILQASHLLQLDNLVDICLQHLRDNLKAETALLAATLFCIYGTTEDQADTHRYVIENFDKIIQTKTFPLINKEDLSLYLDDHSLHPKICWEAIVVWMGKNFRTSDAFFRNCIARFLERQNLSLTFLVKTVWKNPFVEGNEDAKSVILSAIYEMKEIPEDLTLEICFLLKVVMKSRGFTGPNQDCFNKLLNEHLAKNFKESIKKDEFYNCTAQELSSIYTCRHLNCHVETLKWETLLKWVKHEKMREKKFFRMMRLINFGKIPLEYIQRNIRNEPLVNKSGKCKEILLDALLGASASPDGLQVKRSTLVLLDQKSGILTALNLEEGSQTEITRVQVAEDDFMEVTSVRDELFLIRNKNLYRYLNTGIWDERAPLPTSCDWPGEVVTFRDRIYVICESMACCYNPIENNWEKDLPGCGLYTGFCVTASQDFIYALGGSLFQARRFDPEAQKWFEMPQMSDEREYGSAAIVYCGKLYVMGGVDVDSELNSAECYNESDGVWESRASMKKSRCDLGVVAYNDKIYAIGGDMRYGVRPGNESVEVYDKDSDEWKIVQELPDVDGSISICVVNSDVFENKLMMLL